MIRGKIRADAGLFERVRLAAFLGDEAAHLALATEAPRPADTPSGLANGLEAWGHECSVRAGYAAGRLVLPLWEQRPSHVMPFTPHSPTQKLELVGAWIACPCERHLEDARESLEHFASGSKAEIEGPTTWARAHDVVDRVVSNVVRPNDKVGRRLEDAITWAAEAIAANRRRPGAFAVSGDLEVGFGVVRSPIQHDLVGWALPAKDWS